MIEFFGFGDPARGREPDELAVQDDLDRCKDPGAQVRRGRIAAKGGVQAVRQPARGARASHTAPTAEVPPPHTEGASAITFADRVRRWGMVLLLWAFVATSGLSLAAVLFRDEPDTEELLRLAGKNDRELVLALAERPFEHLKQILQILLPAQTALLGSAMGFYYGSQAKSGRTD